MSESLILEKKQYNIEFSDEQYKEVEELAGINYSVKNIAMYLGVDAALLQKEFDFPDSKLKYHYNRGRLIAQAIIEKKNKKNAEEGNTTAVQIFNKNTKETRLNQLKNELFGI